MENFVNDSAHEFCGERIKKLRRTGIDLTDLEQEDGLGNGR